jgi:hypothetical protein
MTALPPLQEADMQALSAAFATFLDKSEAEAVLLTAEGGFLISHYGKVDGFDITSVGALASNSYVANSMMAGMLAEPCFNCIYQQGEKTSVFIQSIDGSNLIIIIFPAKVSVGVIKHYAASTSKEVGKIFDLARDRAPGENLDLVMMNVEDSEDIFKPKTAAPKAAKRRAAK